MKPKPKTETEVKVTTTTALTIQGQTFEMTLDELKALHEKIGKAIGWKPEVVYAPVEREARRPYFPPPPLQWHPPVNPMDPPYKITCSTTR